MLQQTSKLDDASYGQLQEYGLRQIAPRTAGYDMIDLKRAAAHGLQVTNVPAHLPNAIAEYTVWAALNLVRQMNAVQDRVQRHDFRWNKAIRATEIRSLTTGIVGTGRISLTTARIFHGFGARILGFDLYPNPEAPDWLEYAGSLEELLPQDNRHMMDAASFGQMTDGALLDALDSGKVAGAALDVYEYESASVNRDFTGEVLDGPVYQELIDRPNVILTPHIAFFTRTAIHRQPGRRWPRQRLRTAQDRNHRQSSASANSPTVAARRTTGLRRPGRRVLRAVQLQR